jgi:hypothetical protein
MEFPKGSTFLKIVEHKLSQPGLVKAETHEQVFHHFSYLIGKHDFVMLS